MKIKRKNLYLIQAAYKAGWGMGYISGRIRKLF
jgi:hypothetical protein